MDLTEFSVHAYRAETLAGQPNRRARFTSRKRAFGIDKITYTVCLKMIIFYIDYNSFDLSINRADPV